MAWQQARALRGISFVIFLFCNELHDPCSDSVACSNQLISANFSVCQMWTIVIFKALVQLTENEKNWARDFHSSLFFRPSIEGRRQLYHSSKMWGIVHVSTLDPSKPYLDVIQWLPCRKRTATYRYIRFIQVFGFGVPNQLGQNLCTLIYMQAKGLLGIIF